MNITSKLIPPGCQFVSLVGKMQPVSEYVRGPDGNPVWRETARKEMAVYLTVKREADGLSFCLGLKADIDAESEAYECESWIEHVKGTRLGGPDFSQGEADPGMAAVTNAGVRGMVTLVNDETRILRLDTLPGVDIPWADARWDKGDEVAA